MPTKGKCKEEAEDFQPLPAKFELKSNWDVDENDIKDSWEEEGEPAPLIVKAATEKAPKKAAPKVVEKKGKTVEAPKASSREEPLDPIADKLRMQR
ncbi:unnamed protein product [Microthlaspi erraticum]|uniref:Uncharacterized protein n=1 Tax=Microthlaspi erraticum TaxID=1685480 RepID=A0A6D2I705_9BRAS|nr:unnamed protein product [Microthlaspi erraticum]CAA7055746.1 unnamed protein product [Microthlaspi erraticum]